MEIVTKESFEEWLTCPETKRLFKTLTAEREVLKEGLVYNNYEHPDEVKGMCRAIQNILNITYEDMFSDNPSNEPKRD